MEIFLLLIALIFISSKCFASQNWESSADNPVMSDNLQYHIHCKDGDINKYVLLPGDPARTDLIAQEWDESKFIANNREYKTFSGKISNIPVSTCSTGIGGSSAAIAIEELANLGANTFICIGTCGAINPEINCGDIIICSGAVRHDGTSTNYVESSYPAMAHHEIILALIEACERLGKKYHVGISCSTASFHAGQARPGFKNFSQSFHRERIKDLQDSRVLNFEMEAATIFTLANLYGLRAGAVFAVVADRNKNKFVYSGIEDSIIIANEAVKILADWDNLKGERKYFYPGLLVNQEAK